MKPLHDFKVGDEVIARRPGTKQESMATVIEVGFVTLTVQFYGSGGRTWSFCCDDVRRPSGPTLHAPKPDIDADAPDDAWKQHADLMERFTQRTEVRDNLIVTAHGTKRGVEVTLVETIPGAPELANKIYHSTGRRNVATMRQLAQALNDACDFVESVNPRWAAYPKPKLNERGLFDVVDLTQGQDPGTLEP